MFRSSISKKSRRPSFRQGGRNRDERVFVSFNSTPCGREIAFISTTFLAFRSIWSPNKKGHPPNVPQLFLGCTEPDTNEKAKTCKRYGLPQHSMITPETDASLRIDTRNKVVLDGYEDATTMLFTEVTTKTLVEMSWYSSMHLRERCQDVLMIFARVVENGCVSSCQKVSSGLAWSERLPGYTLKNILFRPKIAKPKSRRHDKISRGRRRSRRYTFYCAHILSRQT